MESGNGGRWKMGMGVVRLFNSAIIGIAGMG